MKKKALLNLWLTLGISLAWLFIFSKLEQKLWPDYWVISRFWAYFIALMAMTAVLFDETILFELESGQMELNTSLPVKSGLLSSKLLWINSALFFVFAFSSFFSLWGAYDRWIANIWDPLRIISGWPSFFASLILFFFLLISFFIRDDARYQSKHDKIKATA